MSAIQEKAMLVTLTTSHWSATKFDPKVTKEIDETHGSENSGRFNKILITSNLLKDISGSLNKARTYHYEVTLPWDDKGPRLLPVAKYFDYTKNMEKFQTEHKELVSKFLKEYPELQKLAKVRLNTLYKDADYPDVHTLSSKFNLSYKLSLIADEEDLRITISKNEMEELKKNIKSSLSDRIDNAKNNMIERIETAVKAMHEKLSEPEATFRDSLVGNIVALAELIPSMNFDDDEQFDWLAKKLNKFNVDPKKLRKDMKLRADTAKKAKKLHKKIEKMYYGTKEPVPYVEVKEEKKEKKYKKTKRLR